MLTNKTIAIMETIEKRKYVKSGLHRGRVLTDEQRERYNARRRERYAQNKDRYRVNYRTEEYREYNRNRMRAKSADKPMTEHRKRCIEWQDRKRREGTIDERRAHYVARTDIKNENGEALV